MKVALISGGSGSQQIMAGFYKLTKELPINLINMYDDGKSTGDIRRRLNILGPSDLRKVQCSQAVISLGNLELSSMLEKRLSGTFEDMITYINNSNLRDYMPGYYNIILYFLESIKHEHMNDYSIGNIVYGVLISKYSIDKTVEIMSQALQIENKVVVNSARNSTLTAVTAKGTILNDEASIVDFNNDKDFIKRVMFNSTTTDKAMNLIIDSDIIVISCGTFFSSILPTLNTSGIVSLLRNKRVVVVINEGDDGDTLGWTVSDRVQSYMNVLYSLRDLHFVDPSSLSKRKGDDGYDIELVNKIIEMGYRESFIRAEKLLLDVDGTVDKSIIDSLTEKDVTYVSGNTAYSELVKYILNNGHDIYHTCGLYHNNTKYNSHYVLKVSDFIEPMYNSLSRKFGEVKHISISIIEDTYILLKTTDDRDTLFTDINNYLNDIWSSSMFSLNKRGLTSIEITPTGLQKTSLYRMHIDDDCHTLAIGNEPKGNDLELFNLSNEHLSVNSPLDTALILKNCLKYFGGKR